MKAMSPNLLQKTAEKEKLIREEMELTEDANQSVKKPDNKVRNFLIGISAAFGGYFIFFRKKADAKQQMFRLRSDMLLTKNIRLIEYLISSSMPELKEYTLSVGEYTNVKLNSKYVQMIRDQFGIPVFISSGGRPSTIVRTEGEYKGLNFIQILTEKGYKPATHSQHMDFSASDFSVQNRNLLTSVFKYIMILYNKYPKDIIQSILYVQKDINSDEPGTPDFIHFGTYSILFNFQKLTSDRERFILADVKITKDENGKIIKRDTKFFTYSPEKLKELLT